MPELSARGKFGKLEWTLTGIGGGAGLAIGIAAVKAVGAHPELVAQLLSGGILYFGIAVASMFVFDKRFRDFNAMQTRSVLSQEKNAAAQAELARNVGELVAKDDQRQREQELTLNHLARRSETLASQNEEILQHLKDMKNERDRTN